MKRRALVLSIVVMLAGCATVPARNIDRVQAGMDRDQVRSIMGQPDTVTHSPGKECAYYSLLKDFWSRVPWSRLRPLLRLLRRGQGRIVRQGRCGTVGMTAHGVRDTLHPGSKNVRRQAWTDAAGVACRAL